MRQRYFRFSMIYDFLLSAGRSWQTSRLHSARMFLSSCAAAQPLTGREEEKYFLRSLLSHIRFLSCSAPRTRLIPHLHSAVLMREAPMMSGLFLPGRTMFRHGRSFIPMILTSSSRFWKTLSTWQSVKMRFIHLLPVPAPARSLSMIITVS